MKNLFALIVAAVMLLIMTASVAALPAPSAGVQPISAYDLIGTTPEQLCSIFENAGYYYVVLGYDQVKATKRDGSDPAFVIKDTRPGEHPLPEMNFYTTGDKGNDEYYNLVNIYTPDDLDNAACYFEAVNSYDVRGITYEDYVYRFDTQEISLGDYVVDPLQAFYTGMTTEEAMIAADRMGLRYTIRRYHFTDDRVGNASVMYITDGKYEYCLVLSDKVTTRIYVAKHNHSELGYDSDTDLGYGYGDVDYFNWDLNNHWRSCLCGETFDFGEHEFLNGRCKVCGATEGVIPEVHAHDNDNIYDNYVYYSVENGHYKVCHACGSVQYSSFEEHYFGNNQTGKCSDCGYLNTDYIHDHVYQYTYFDNDYHIYDCIFCDSSWHEGHYDRYEEYTYFTKNSIFHYYNCTKCNEPVLQCHSYSRNNPNECEDCHFKCPEHECDYQWIGFDSYQYCVICGRQGSINHNHEWKWDFTPESHTIKCAICGDKRDLSPDKHDFVFDTCIWCGYTRGTITFLPGDLNSSGGDPDVLDGVVMQRILASLEPEITAADLNRDGIVNVADGVVMQRILAGLE